ncbi:DUF2207 family protein [Dactylosporangium sp. CA-152071]|uniref:DUF2207 family protein n=1 Tax=Dactylosporangium sp. CA-152071 TaxID=3239933 RepID=UPI003D923ACD
MDWPPFLEFSVPAALAVWAAAVAVTLWRSRPRLPEPGPARTDLPGQEPPAVVSLMVNRWRSDEDAIDSTLLDLAARGFLELRETGSPAAGEPAQTTARLRKGDGRSLTPYEQQILDRVHHLSVNGETTLTSLAFDSWTEARRWRRTFYRAVVAEARTRGLCTPRLAPKTRRALLLGAILPALLMFITWWWVDSELSAKVPDQVTGAIIGAAAVYLAQYLVVDFNWADQTTPEGVAATESWLGLREHLTTVEGVADLAPADVASWGREMAYASALGVLSADDALVRLTPGARSR